MIVALGHQSRVGKDTLAVMLIEELGKLGRPAWRIGFADALKDSAHQLFGRLGLETRAYYDRNPWERTEPLPGAPHLTPVKLWIAFGEAMKSIDPRIWLDAGLSRADATHADFVLMPDLRFPLEAEEIRRRGGVTVKVTRPGQVTHASDHALHGWDWDVIMANEGTLDDLRRDARDLADYLIERKGK